MKRQITNIRWEAEHELPKVDGSYGVINEDLFYMLFNYNGYEVTAVVSFTLRCKDDDDNYNEGAWNYGTDTTVDLFSIKEMYINDGEEYKLPLKEFRELEDYLGNDLETQF